MFRRVLCMPGTTVQEYPVLSQNVPLDTGTYYTPNMTYYTPEQE